MFAACPSEDELLHVHGRRRELSVHERLNTVEVAQAAPSRGILVSGIAVYSRDILISLFFVIYVSVSPLVVH